MQQKINWINNLKVIGILAVILGHINSPFSNFIFSWHMPLFFLISGFFINFDLSFRYFITKDSKRLLIPYFLFSIFALTAEVLKRHVLHRDSLNIFDELQGVFIWMDFSSLSNTYAFVLWFLPTLFFSRLFLYVLNKKVNNVIIQLIIVLALFGLSFFINTPFAIDNSLNALIFVFIGNIFFKHCQNNKLLYFLPFIFIFIYLLLGMPVLNMADKFYSNIFINIIFSLSIIYTLILSSKTINSNTKLLTTWGNNTMILFIIHPYTNNIAHIIAEKLHSESWALRFLISIVLLQIVLIIKSNFKNRGIFKYV